jgi:hypothetical protein
MVVADYPSHALESGNALHELRPPGTVALHHRPLIGGEHAGLQQHGVGNADLADVVEAPRVPKVGQGLVGDS